MSAFKRILFSRKSLAGANAFFLLYFLAASAPHRVHHSLERFLLLHRKTRVTRTITRRHSPSRATVPFSRPHSMPISLQLSLSRCRSWSSRSGAITLARSSRDLFSTHHPARRELPRPSKFSLVSE